MTTPAVAATWEEIPAEAVRPGVSRKGFGTVVLKRVAPQSLNGASVLERTDCRYLWTLVAPLASVAVESSTTAES